MTRRVQSSAEVTQPRFKAKVTSRISSAGEQPQMERHLSRCHAADFSVRNI
jgi:hypothetical protein